MNSVMPYTPRYLKCHKIEICPMGYDKVIVSVLRFNIIINHMKWAISHVSNQHKIYGKVKLAGAPCPLRFLWVLGGLSTNK
ncbi:hypothetical protein PUN28_000775 [Cardiocondyla obscurior]|uniref:Uncharacterized protein n=1 Tax=Cardiocondyla obscurior TaxID=286306 RepID=A0AAW2H1E4_9HYME